MDRRKFLSVGGTAAGAAALTGCGETTPNGGEGGGAAKQEMRPMRMHVGTQRGPTNPEMLQYFKRHGINHIVGYPPRPPADRGYWLDEEVVQTREMCEKHGIELEVVALPFLSSSHIDREKRGAIMMADSPERDRDIEHIQKMIISCSKAGVNILKYNMSLLGVLRLERTPGRGGSTYSTWKVADAKPDPPLTRAGRVNDEQAWERITYFLDRVIPAAAEYKVHMACHPHDPGVPPEGYQGIVRVLGTAEGLYKFVSIQDSPYHGMNLCLGSTAEMLHDPDKEIHDVIRRLGEPKKIFNVHFRNIRGGRDDFQEVWPDEGDMNMVNVARTLGEVDYPHIVMPDHIPRHDDDPGGRQGFAFAYGHIIGILQSLQTMG